MKPDAAIQVLREHIAFCGESFRLSDAVRVFNEFYLFLRIDSPSETVDCLSFSAGMMQSEFGLRPTLTLSRARGMNSIISVSLVYSERLPSVNLDKPTEHCHSVQESPGFFQNIYASESYQSYASVHPAKFSIDLMGADEIEEGAERMGLLDILEGEQG